MVHLEFRVYWGVGKPVVLIFREEGRLGGRGGDAGGLVRVHIRHLFWIVVEGAARVFNTFKTSTAMSLNVQVKALVKV